MAKKTKIVATLGLVSDSKEVLKTLIENGMNVARLNFSHGSYEWHGKVIDIIRELSDEMGVAIGILADLQGPRIRTLVDAPVEIAKGETILFSDVTYKENVSGEKKAILLDVPNIIDDIEIGHEILIEDGIMKVVVKEKSSGVLACEVIDGGTVNNHKGVNIPDAKLKISPITEKDQKDLEFVLSKGVDFVAMSFVSTGENIEDLRGRMKKILGEDAILPQIIAKIERKEAIKNLEDIIEHTDAVMVARGDLGIEIEGTRVAVLQKEIIRKSMSAMKPVIVATQMLNSMIENPRPTRAEVSDVTNAVVDHADAVMLSGESASGKYPVESVRTMKDIIENTEASPFDDMVAIIGTPKLGGYDEIVRSGYELAKNTHAKAIVMGSRSGLTARLFSHFRPDQPMFVATKNKMTCNQLTLVWGVKAWYYEKPGSIGEDVDWLIEDAKKSGELLEGDKIVLVLGRAPGREQMRLVGLKEI